MPRNRVTFFARVALFAAGAGATALADEANAACWKWRNQLAFCDVLNASVCNTPMETWTHGRKRTWFEYHHGDTALEACQKYYKKHWGSAYTGPVTSGPIASNPRIWANCYVDGNWDGIFSRSEQTIAHTTVDRYQVTRESCCEENVWGPYADLGPSFETEDYSFEPDQKDAIRAQNEFNNQGVSKSDMRPSLPYGNDYHEELTLNNTFWNCVDDSYFIPYIWAPTGMEVDHIVPRVDVHGCLCGPNSFSNALLISHELNNEMSNDCSHPKRQQILDKWRVPQ